MSKRTFGVTIPATTVFYEVDTDRFHREYDGNMDLQTKLEDEVQAAFELGTFGDDDIGFDYLGGDTCIFHGEFYVREVQE